MYPIKIRYLFSGKASVKHLTTTDDVGSPRLMDEEQEEKKDHFIFQNPKT